MIPLAFYEIGKDSSIKKINGNDKIRRHLGELGFVVGTPVKIISVLYGNLIIQVKNSRIALNRDTANKILVKEL
ncbi:MAG: FeoA family protein [Sphaerochaetaceae bacterium]